MWRSRSGLEFAPSDLGKRDWPTPHRGVLASAPCLCWPVAPDSGRFGPFLRVSACVRGLLRGCLVSSRELGRGLLVVTRDEADGSVAVCLVGGSLLRYVGGGGRARESGLSPSVWDDFWVVGVVDLPRWGPMLSSRVPNLVPIPGPGMERVTPDQRPRPNYGHPQGRPCARAPQRPCRLRVRPLPGHIGEAGPRHA